MFRFEQHFFPDNLLLRLQALNLFTGRKVMNRLTDVQEHEAKAICRKLNVEKSSSYPFSKELQLAYVSQLLHLLLKARN
ncbi:hypothetical protein FLA_0818 [Filimonas lacunae]|nr:hypothetical protein FLA_0818 [Filimonas lacunae]